MKKNLVKRLVAVAMLPLALSSCSNKLEKEYGPKITREAAMTALQAIAQKNSSVDTIGPTSFSISHTGTGAFIIIAVIPYTENMSYDLSKQYYHSEIGSTKRWVYVKDGVLYNVKSFDTTAKDSSDSSYTVTTKTYTTGDPSAFSAQVSAVVTDKYSNDNRPILSSRMDPTKMHQIGNIEEPTDFYGRLKLFNDGNGTYTSNNYTYTISGEEYRSSGDGTLYASFTSNEKDTSSTSKTVYTIGIKDYLTATSRDKQTFLDYGYDFTWNSCTTDYPDLSSYTKQ